jgi:NAD(P)-dependent dehydrogenase (short-subunit alcohol dehydrogenase family)
VALTYVSSAKGAQETVSQIESEGSPKAIAVQADCSDPTTAAPKIVAETIKNFGERIDIIVNNAANGSDQSLETVELDIFNIMFHTNVLFPLLLVKESMAYLSRGGRIVNISSSGARTRQLTLLYKCLMLLTTLSLQLCHIQSSIRQPKPPWKVSQEHWQHSLVSRSH